MIKSRRMRWAGHAARMGAKRTAYRILVGKPEGNRPLGRLDVDGWIIQDVRMKGSKNKKMYISETNCHTHIRFMSSEKKTLKVFFHARLTGMRQLVTFCEIGNSVDTTGTGSMRLVASRVAISYGCPASF
jgi:hypothetical protein